jgi:ABC-2 type transport system permease protein
MLPRRAYAIFLRQFYLLRGSITRVIPLFVWVAIDMVLWGFITRYLNGVTESGMNFVPILLGAVLLWDFFIRVMQGVSMAFLEDVWSRNFLNIFATPLTIAEYLSGLVFSSIATSAVGLIVMLVMASLIFDLSYFAYGVALFPFLLTLFMSGIALGILGVSLVLRFGPASEWFLWPLPALISPFCGVFYPLSVMPQWMQGVAKILPPSYVFEGLRTIASGQSASTGTLVTGVALAAFYIVLSCMVFTLVYRRAVKTGLIARYSAESVS